MNLHTFGTSPAALRLVEVLEESEFPRHNRRLSSKFLSSFNHRMNRLLELTDESTFISAVDALYNEKRNNIINSSMDEYVKTFVLAVLKTNMNNYRDQYSGIVTINVEPYYA